MQSQVPRPSAKLRWIFYLRSSHTYSKMGSSLLTCCHLTVCIRVKAITKVPEYENSCVCVCVCVCVFMRLASGGHSILFTVGIVYNALPTCTMYISLELSRDISCCCDFEAALTSLRAGSIAKYLVTKLTLGV